MSTLPRNFQLPTSRTAPPGFLVPPKPRNTPIERMTVRELRDAHARNARILCEPYVPHFVFTPVCLISNPLGQRPPLRTPSG